MTKGFHYKRSLGWLAALFVFFTLTVPSPADAQDSAATHAAMMERSIQDQVKSLREERFEMMPYLDKSYVRSVINKEKIQKRTEFVQGEGKTLVDLVSRSLSVSTRAKTSRERISLARRRVLGAVRNLFPEATFEFAEKDGLLSSFPFNSRNVRFTFRQPVFHGGNLWNTLLQEKASLEAAEKEYEAARQELMKDVALAYFDYVRAWESMAGQRNALQVIRPYVEISNQKYASQLISEIENLNVQSLYSQVRYDYETAKQEVELAELELQKFLDLGRDAELEVASLYDINLLLEAEQNAGQREDDYLMSNGPDPELKDLMELAYQHRAELQVEAAKLESARFEERARWGDFMPQADVIIEYGKLGEAFNQVTTDPGLRREFRFSLEINWNMVGNSLGYVLERDERGPSVTQFAQGSGSLTKRNSLSLGILDSLSDFVSTKEAEVQKLEQVVKLEEAEKQVMQSVKQSYFDYQKAKIQVKSTLQRSAYRQRLASLSKHRLEKNEIQISEYVQAEIDFLKEMDAVHRALKDYFSAKASLNYAIGISDYLPIEGWYEPKSAS